MRPPLPTPVRNHMWSPSSSSSTSNQTKISGLCSLAAPGGTGAPSTGPVMEGRSVGRPCIRSSVCATGSLRGWEDLAR
jgi:hypothetical protein